MMRKLLASKFVFTYILLVALFLGTNNRGWGQAATATWSLTTNSEVVTTGNVSAVNLVSGSGLANVDYNSGTYFSSRAYNRTSQASAITNNDYLEFTVTPSSGSNLNVSSISFGRGVSGGTINISVLFSTDPTFATSTSIGTTSFNNTTLATTSYTPNYNVPSGGTLYVRIYGWNLGTTNYFRINNLSISGTTCFQEGDPNTFGNNSWNVYAYNGASMDLSGINYRGYYTVTGTPSFNSTTSWDNFQSPSSATGYRGCSVVTDAFTFVYKRQGFPCGVYQIDCYHDDDARLYIDGVLEWSSASYGSVNNIWTGALDANSKVEYRVMDGNGASSGALTFTSIPIVADFSATPLSLVQGNTVDFSDLSDGNVSSWSWSFPGGTPLSSSEQNPTVTYVTPGTYNVSLTVNVCGSDVSVTKTGYITVTAQSACNPISIWTEPFTYNNNTATGIGAPASVTTWTRTGTSSVNNNRFRFRSQTTESIWSITSINIAPYSGVTVTMAIDGSDTDLDANDYVICEYNVGSGWVTLTNGNKNGVFAAITATANIPNGSSSLLLRVRANCNVVNNNEDYFLDNISITGTPVIAVNDPTDLTKCAGDATAVSYTGTGATTYLWTNNNTSIGLPASGSGDIASFEALNTGNTPQIATITVTPSNGTCVGTAQTFMITINPATVPGSVSGGTTICSGSTSGLLSLGTYTGTVIRWESSVSPFTVWTPITNTADTYTSGALTQTTQFRAVVQSGSCLVANSAATTVTVDPTTVPGSVSGGTTICSGSTSGLLSLGTYTGSVVRWESSVSPFTVWTPITNIADTYTSGALTQTTQFRAVVQSGSCLVANSTATTVTVDPTTVPGTVSGGTTICSGSTSGLLSLGAYTGNVVRWESSVSPFSAWTPITHTADTYTSGALTQTTQFRAVVQSGSCLVANSAPVLVTVVAQPFGPTINIKTPGLTDICTGQGVSATFNAGSGGTGCSDDYIVIIDGGAATAYTPGSTVGTSATGSIVIQGRRANCTAGSGCTGTSYVTLASWTVSATPVGPTINIKTPNLTNICTGQGVSATFNAGSGGTGCSDDYIVIIDGGAATAYIPGSAVGTSATSSIVIQGRRANCTAGSGCTGTSYVTLASWTVNDQPIADDITPNVSAGNVCAGQSLSATFGGASGGTGTIVDVHEFSIDGGSSYSVYSSAINTTSLAGQTVIIRTSRTATGTGCTTSAYKMVSWTILDINASVSDISANPSGSCPDFNDFNGNTEGYRAGYTILKFQVLRELSTSAWIFDYTLSGGTLYSGSPESASATKSIIAGSNSVDLIFYIANTPGSAQTIEFKVVNVRDTNCIHNGINITKTHTISEMPAIGSFN